MIIICSTDAYDIIPSPPDSTCLLPPLLSLGFLSSGKLANCLLLNLVQSGIHLYSIGWSKDKEAVIADVAGRG
jgi:hypothetical protein